MKKLGICLIIISFSMVAFYFIYNKSLENKNINGVNDYIDITSIVNDDKGEVEKEKTNTPQKEKQLEHTTVLDRKSVV